MLRFNLLLLTVLGWGISPMVAADDTSAPGRTVRLSESGLPLSKALAEIEKQMGMRKGSLTDRRGEGDPQLKVSLQNVPFWKAIDAIANEVGASVYLSPRDGKISLVNTYRAQVPISYSGPFRLAIKRVTVFQDLETNTHHATAAIEAAWEPQVQPFLFQTRPQVLVVKDDKDRTLAFNSEGKASDSVDGRMAHQFDVALPAPSRAVTQYGLIEGSFSALAPSKMLTFRFGALDQIAQAAPDSPLRPETGWHHVPCHQGGPDRRPLDDPGNPGPPTGPSWKAFRPNCGLSTTPLFWNPKMAAGGSPRPATTWMKRMARAFSRVTSSTKTAANPATGTSTTPRRPAWWSHRFRFASRTSRYRGTAL